MLGHFKAHTNRPITTGSVVKTAVESADSTSESADSTTDSIIIVSLVNLVDILDPLESVDGNRLTIGVSQWQISPSRYGLSLGFTQNSNRYLSSCKIIQRFPNLSKVLFFPRLNLIYPSNFAFKQLSKQS